ncbi:MAG TPA: benzoate-CoA ligase family protein [Pyrinomonadaceae bacterium]|nr:benzoate-CoA ligase family protein [Pyrinomonadaceae bacterium]
MNLFEAIFSAGSDSCSVIFAGREISYAALKENTLQMVESISQMGVARGDRIAFLLNDSPEFISAFIATCSLGAIAVPVNMALRPEEQCSILHNSGARLALVEPNFRKLFLTDAFEKLQDLESVVVIDHRNDGQSAGFEQIRRKQVNRQTEISDIPARDMTSPGPDDPAFILYTSGSTGEPKGAIHTQADMFATNAGFCKQVLSLTPTDRLFSSSRLPFAYGLGNSLTFPLLNGATTILSSEKPTPDVISSIFVRDRPTIYFGVPVVYNRLLEHHNRGSELDCSSLRLCVSAGEALPAHLGETWEKTFGVPILDGIGSTEMLHMFMSNKQNDIKYGSSGKVLDGYEAKLLDSDGSSITADNQEGHLWIKGASAARAYWKRPEETEKTFVDGWVRTGDLYVRDQEGFWFHMGRSDDCFKSSGRWVSPIEVEGVLLRHGRVARAAVVEDFDDEHLPCACAFIVSEDVESNPSEIESELRALAAESLPKFKRPRRYIFLDELPYTATGKVQRFKLRQELRDRRSETDDK